MMTKLEHIIENVKKESRKVMFVVGSGAWGQF